MAHDVHPAGVRRHHPADCRRVSRAEVHADLPADAARCSLHQRQRRTRPDRDLAGNAIGVLDLVQAQQAYDHLTAARHRPADEPGIAALRHDGRARMGAPTSTLATSSVDPGRTTASASPWNRRVQSVSYEARRPGSVRQWLSPTISASLNERLQVNSATRHLVG